MASYTLVPSDSLVIIDGTAATGVNFAGIDPTIHAIQWQSIIGEIEYVFDFINNSKRPNERITSMAPYQSYIDQAQQIINAAENPLYFYSTQNGNVYGGDVYYLGQPIVIDTPNTPQPPYTTSLIPPTPEEFQQLYWYANAWVVSSVDPSLSLPQAQAALNRAAEAYGAENVNQQSRIYSGLQMIQAADAGALATADYYGLTLGDYQTYIDTEVAAFAAQVSGATSVPQLYNLNPMIDPNPN